MSGAVAPKIVRLLAFDANVDLDRECRGYNEQSRDEHRHDQRESVKHESSFREGFELPAAEVF